VGKMSEDEEELEDSYKTETEPAITDYDDYPVSSLQSSAILPIASDCRSHNNYAPFANFAIGSPKPRADYIILTIFIPLIGLVGIRKQEARSAVVESETAAR